MSRGAATLGTSTSVNLLSPWVFDDLHVQRLRRRFAYAAIALALVIALVWTWQRLNLHAANEELRGEETTAASLTEQVDALAPIKTYMDGVERRVSSVQSATYADVAFSQVVIALREALPPGAELTTVSVDLAATQPAATTSPSSSGDQAASSAEIGAKGADPARGLDGSTCPGPDPFGTTVVVGCITLEGTASDRDAVGRLVIALGNSPLFVEPFVDATTTADGTEVTFSGTVGLSPKVFSRRFDSLTAEIDKERDQ